MKNIYLLTLIILCGMFSSNVFGQTCQPPNAIPQPSFNHWRCYDASDTVNANPSSNSHYTYSWSTGATTSSIVISQAQDSTFSVTVTNTQLNCSAVFTDTVRNDLQISNTNILTLICSDSASADLQLDGVGGDGVFTYYLSGIASNTSGYFPNLQAGGYTFNIIDSVGCSLYGGPTTLSIPATAKQQTFDITYSAGCTQNKTITVTPVTGQGLPLEYELNGGGFSSNNTFSNEPPGTYTIVVKDEDGGCTDTLKAVVNPTGSIASPVYHAAICYGVTNDTINANPNDSTGLTYSWNTGATTPFIVSAGGSFSVTITDAAADCSASFTGYISKDPEISNTNILTFVCSDTASANLQLDGVGGDSIFTYTLTGKPANTSGYFPGLDSGTYIFNIIDSLGCTLYPGPTTIYIPTVAQNATFNLQVIPPTCNTLANGEIIITPTTPAQVGFYQYSLNGGAAQTDTIFSNVGVGADTISILNFVTGCAYDTFTALTAPQGDSATVTPDSINSAPGTKDTMTVTTTFPNPGYSWYPNVGLSCDTCASPTVTIDSSMNGKYYYVKSFTLGDTGCYALDSVLIHSQIPVLFAMPSAFTPNNDGIDDYFGPASATTFLSPTVKSLRIYNRWGQLVYSSTAPNAAWDGKFKGEEQPVGTYVYYIEVQYTNPDTGQPVTAKQEGSVTLLR